MNDNGENSQDFSTGITSNISTSPGQDLAVEALCSSPEDYQGEMLGDIVFDQRDDVEIHPRDGNVVAEVQVEQGYTVTTELYETATKGSLEGKILTGSQEEAREVANILSPKEREAMVSSLGTEEGYEVMVPEIRGYQ